MLKLNGVVILQEDDVKYLRKMNPTICKRSVEISNISNKFFLETCDRNLLYGQRDKRGKTVMSLFGAEVSISVALIFLRCLKTLNKNDCK